MPSIPRLDPPIADGRVSLRDYAERDIPEILIAHQDDPTMYVRLGLDRQPSAAELGRQAEEESARRVRGAGARLTVLEGGSDECRGRVLVHAIDWENSRAELGVWIVPQARAKGAGRSALRLAAQWLFGVCGLARVQLLTDPDNQPMLHAASAAGFAHEGVLRSYSRWRTARQDMAILSLLPSDLDG